MCLIFWVYTDCMGKRYRIVIEKAANKQLFVKLVAPNNKILMHSETMKSRQAIKKNVEAMKQVAKTAVVEDKTKKKA